MNFHRHDGDANVLPPPVKDLEKVPNGRTGRAGDHRDMSWDFRQGLFVDRIEQSFDFELGMELSERKLQRPFPLRLGLPDDDLVAAPLGIDIDVTMADDFHPVFELEFHPLSGGPPDDRANLSRLVLEREIQMPGTWASQARDFSADPNAGKLVTQLKSDFAGQFRNGENVDLAGIRQWKAR